MSVYKPAKGKFWHYDFVLKGHRYCGSTGATTESKAKRVEEAKRVAAACGELNRPQVEVPTLGVAAATWWQSKAHLKSADQLLTRANLAVELIGKHKPVNEVTFADVQRAIQKRREIPTPSKRRPANATINRDLISTLRPIVKLADEMLNGDGAKVPFPTINWGKLRLSEPKPKPKGLTAAQLEKLIAALPEHLHDFVRFQARYGCRISEMFFRLDDVDIEGQRVTLRGADGQGRKGGDEHVIPILADDVRMLSARISRARVEGLDTVWFREVADKKLKRRVLKARTVRGVGRALSEAVTRAGIRAAMGARGSHNLRHTAGMETLRASKNLRAVQRLLGHASIQSTLVYAHAIEDDVRAALDAVSRPVPEQPPVQRPGRRPKPLIRKHN